MSTLGNVRDLVALTDDIGPLTDRIAGRKPVVFLDYDGTLTPIVERPDLAVLDEAVRNVVRDLAGRLPVAVVSGRDRPDVERLVGIEGLIYAGSHGFDIQAPGGRRIEKDLGAEFAPLLDRVKATLHRQLDDLPGALIEPKRASVAVHYRNVAPDRQGRVAEVVEAIVGDVSGLRITPGKMVFEIQPAVDWDKGRAVLYLLQALGLDGDDVAALYFGDDVTDEDAFRALAGRGIGLYVGPAEDRPTAADFRIDDPAGVSRILDRLAR